MQHVVDVTDILVDLIVALLQLMDILLKYLVRPRIFRHVAARTEDIQQMAFTIVYRHEFQLIVHSLVQEACQGPVVVGTQNLGHVHGLEVIDIEIADTQHLLNGDLLPDDGLFATREELAGLVVHVDDDPMFVIDHHVDHGRVEDRLITRHVILDQELSQTFFCDIYPRAENGGRLSGPVAAQHRHIDGVIVLGDGMVFGLFHLDVEGDGFFTTEHHVDQPLSQQPEVVLAVAAHELGHVECLCGLAVFIEPFEGLGGYVVYPKADMTAAEHERQAVVALADLPSHLALTDAIIDIVDEEGSCEADHHGSQFPYPRGDARVDALGVEPFVADTVELILCLELRIHAVDALQQPGIS